MLYGKMRLGYRIVKEFAHVLLTFFAGKKVVGLENVPLSGPLWIVSNHQSNVDPPLIGSTIPREIFYAAKRSLFRGLLGKLITYLNAVPVNRTGFDKDMVRRLTREVNNGNAVLIFPEGTRSLDGTFLPIKPGLGMLFLLAPAPVLPIRVEGSWQLDKKRLRKEPLIVYIGNIISAEELLDVSKQATDKHQAITEFVFQRIRQMGNGNPYRAAKSE
ncbi:MAG: 1-acyl-sn-glycerol-3-phosphate acyltransferase [bacterium]|nr:1-acyl-sn-glycerol-3-phosphate acyltransferase [bacterium]